MFGPWIRLSLDTTMLALEAQTSDLVGASDVAVGDRLPSDLGRRSSNVEAFNNRVHSEPAGPVQT